MSNEELASSSQPAPLLPCALVNSLARNTEERCKFIIDNGCLEDEATIDYAYMVYCEFGDELRHAAIVMLVFFVIVLFLNLSAVADEFLCPNLLTVARNLRMSDSLAGVTLLAFGNGCPDIFASLAAASSNRPELLVGELLGAGIFCTSVVAGLILIRNDFKLAGRPLLRDTTFYLLAVYLIWSHCYDQKITFYGSMAFIIIYVIYLVVALSGQAVHARLRGDYSLATEQIKNQFGAEEEEDESETYLLRSMRKLSFGGRQSIRTERRVSNAAKLSQLGSHLLEITCPNCKLEIVQDNLKSSSSTSPAAAVSRKLSKGANKHLPKLAGDERLKINAKALECDLKFANASFSSQQQVGHLERLVSEQSGAKQTAQVFLLSKLTAAGDANGSQAKSATKFNKRTSNWSEWTHFLTRVNPIDPLEWNESSLFGKLVSVLRAPLLLTTILTVPVVDLEKKNNNWCRMLNSLHCFTIPMAMVLSTKWTTTNLPQTAEQFDQLEEVPFQLFGVPVQIVLALPAIALALFVFTRTNGSKPPEWHFVFAYVGFAMSIAWVYTLAKEIISLLKTVGIVFSLSDTAIGLGILAWGNSLGDLVANLSLAEAGYPRMALGASIGAPLFNLLIGFGLSFMLNLGPETYTPIYYTPTITLLCSTLASVLLLLMASTLAPSNQSKRPLGYLLIATYCIYFVLAVCIECGLF